MTYLLNIPHVKMDSFQIGSTLSDSHSLKSLLLQAMTTSKYKGVYIHNLGYITLQISFDAGLASMHQQNVNRSESNTHTSH